MGLLAVVEPGCDGVFEGGTGLGGDEQIWAGGDGDLLFEGVDGSDGAVRVLLEDDTFLDEGGLEVARAFDGGFFGEGDGEILAFDGADDATFVVDAGIAEVGADDDAIRGGGEGDAVDELSGADQGGATGFAGGSYLTGANAGFDIAGEDDAEGFEEGVNHGVSRGLRK